MNLEYGFRTHETNPRRAEIPVSPHWGCVIPADRNVCPPNAIEMVCRANSKFQRVTRDGSTKATGVNTVYDFPLVVETGDRQTILDRGH